MLRALILSVLVLPFAASSGSAAVLAIGNMTKAVVTFKLTHPGQLMVQEASLEPGEHRLFTVGKSPVIAYEAAGKSVRFQLDPYMPYVFAPVGESYGLQGIELAGVMPKLDQIPEAPPELPPYVIKLRVFANQHNPRPRAGWEKLFQDRIQAASEILKKQCNVELKITEFAEWKSDDQAVNVTEMLKDFDQKTTKLPGVLNIGFLSQPGSNVDLAKNPELALLAGSSRGPCSQTFLIRESVTRSEAAKLEMLLQELGHHLGAVHSPDLNTSMRPIVLDGRSDKAEVRPGYDPLNLLIIGLWLEELRTGKVNGPAQLSELGRERLVIAYKTLQALFPEDPLAEAYLKLLAKKDATPGETLAIAPPMPMGSSNGQNLKIPAPVGPERVKVAPPSPPIEPKPNLEPITPANPSQPREQAIRQVVRAITERGKQHKQLPQDQRVRSDALAADYIQTAAEVASQLPAEHRVAAFLIGLGIGLDDSKVLRTNPFKGIATLCQQVESDSEFAERVAYLGLPTMRYRRDLCQHFVVSAALTVLVGEKEAEAIGLGKELLDSQKPSGFSFADLCADYAGVAWAKRVLAEPKLLETIRRGVNVQQLLPSVADLPEGLTTKRFLAEYGGPDDERFKKAVADLRQRVAELK